MTLFIFKLLLYEFVEIICSHTTLVIYNIFFLTFYVFFLYFYLFPVITMRSITCFTLFLSFHSLHFRWNEFNTSLIGLDYLSLHWIRTDCWMKLYSFENETNMFNYFGFFGQCNIWTMKLIFLWIYSNRIDVFGFYGVALSIQWFFKTNMICRGKNPY